MWDGSAVPLDENIEIAQELLPRLKAINAILEVEIGVVGGEEDGVKHEGSNDALYTTVADVTKAVEGLGLGENGRWIAALTFGNVHGVYKPGNVKLRPELLGEIQEGIAAKFGTGPKPLDLVFHGGSGSTDEEIALAVANGVIKMNIDTDTQYAFTRAVAGFMFSNYDGVLKVDGEVGNKKAYDPRAWGKVAESAMAARVVQATQQLGSAGKSTPDADRRRMPRPMAGASVRFCATTGRRTRRAVRGHRRGERRRRSRRPPARRRCGAPAGRARAAARTRSA